MQEITPPSKSMPQLSSIGDLNPINRLKILIEEWDAVINHYILDKFPAYRKETADDTLISLEQAFKASLLPRALYNTSLDPYQNVKYLRYLLGCKNQFTYIFNIVKFIFDLMNNDLSDTENNQRRKFSCKRTKWKDEGNVFCLDGPLYYDTSYTLTMTSREYNAHELDNCLSMISSEKLRFMRLIRGLAWRLSHNDSERNGDHFDTYPFFGVKTYTTTPQSHGYNNVLFHFISHKFRSQKHYEKRSDDPFYYEYPQDFGFQKIGNRNLINDINTRIFQNNLIDVQPLLNDIYDYFKMMLENNSKVASEYEHRLCAIIKPLKAENTTLRERAKFLEIETWVTRIKFGYLKNSERNFRHDCESLQSENQQLRKKVNKEKMKKHELQGEVNDLRCELNIF